jgi:zinc protease
MAGEGAAPPLDENALGEAWADLGAGFEAGADSDALRFSLRSLTDPRCCTAPRAWPRARWAEPSWPADIWQRERARWSASHPRSPAPARHRGGRSLRHAVYGSHPYGQRATPETLARIEVADMQRFHARTIAACRARVSIVGAVNRAQAQTLVATLLAACPARRRQLRAPAGGARVQALKAPAEQAFPLRRPRPMC